MISTHFPKAVALQEGTLARPTLVAHSLPLPSYIHISFTEEYHAEEHSVAPPPSTLTIEQQAIQIRCAKLHRAEPFSPHKFLVRDQIAIKQQLVIIVCPLHVK